MTPLPEPTLAAVSSFASLVAAAKRAARGKRLAPEAARFLFDLEPEVLRLERELRARTWQPGPFRTFIVTEPKPRTISAASDTRPKRERQRVRRRYSGPVVSWSLLRHGVWRQRRC